LAELATKILEQFIQFVPNVYFIFAGSKQHMMSDMFLSPERPFYQGAQIVNIKEIDESPISMLIGPSEN